MVKSGVIKNFPGKIRTKTEKYGEVVNYVVLGLCQWLYFWRFFMNYMSDRELLTRDPLLDGPEPIRPVNRFLGQRPVFIVLLTCWAVSRVLMLEGLGTALTRNYDALVGSFDDLTRARRYSAAGLRKLMDEAGSICHEGRDQDFVESLRRLNELETFELLADQVCGKNTGWLDQAGLSGDCACLEGDESDLVAGEECAEEDL